MELSKNGLLHLKKRVGRFFADKEEKEEKKRSRDLLDMIWKMWGLDIMTAGPFLEICA